VSPLRAEWLCPASSRWEALLERLPYDFYHLPGYVELEARRLGAEAKAFAVEDSGRALLLPLLFRPIPATDLSDAVSPYGYPGPVTNALSVGVDNDFLAAAAAALEAGLHELGAVTAFVRCHPLFPPPAPFLAAVGAVHEHAPTVVVDLTLPDGEQWAQVRPSHRYEIRRAQAAGLQASLGQATEMIEEFSGVYGRSMQRLNAAPEYNFGADYLWRLLDVLGTRAWICRVGQDSRLACAGLFVVTAGVVQFHLAGTEEEFVRLSPSKLMLDTVRRWAVSRGERLLHLGGGVSAASDSLLAFKAGFSQIRCPFRTWRLIIDEALHRELCRRTGRDAAATDTSGFFPAYRCQP
jgi:hypothetical protein